MPTARGACTGVIEQPVLNVAGCSPTLGVVVEYILLPGTIRQGGISTGGNRETIRIQLQREHIAYRAVTFAADRRGPEGPFRVINQPSGRKLDRIVIKPTITAHLLGCALRSVTRSMRVKRCYRTRHRLPLLLRVIRLETSWC